MALYTYHHDAPTVCATGRRWAQACLVDDGSVFSSEPLATPANFDVLDRHFVQRPDEGEGTFYAKLKTQLADAPPAACKLMAESLWALFLFPSNIGEQTKRDGVLQVWGWSGDVLDPAHPLLADGVLDGIGSAGMGVNTNRWRELNYLIGLARIFKRLPAETRAATVADYDRFMDFMDAVPPEGNRQFRHMLRYFLFPERVERMSSNADRRWVLAAFGVAPMKAMQRWSDRQFDDALLSLREEQQRIHGTTDLDFYLEPLREKWKRPNEPDEAGAEDGEEAASARVREQEPAYARSTVAPRNLILYGPPGTGKTWRMQQWFDKYTDQPADVDRAGWEQQLVARYGWRAVIAAALAGIGGPAKATALAEHALVRAKAAQRQRTRAVIATMWSYMQEHSVVDSATVKVAIRRTPFIFDKGGDSQWRLVPEWRELDVEAAELADAWQAGPGPGIAPVQRYRVVTFHPSYSYEDFVVGLRPVAQSSDGDGAAGFRMVDGVFKQACAEARANPGKRHALFIDEINRANIAKVFGELITLIEPDKRARYDASGALIGGMEVQLPGTGADDGEDERFGVPENLDIIGTMNTADRSIALLDIALRRRFEFEEIPPDYDVVQRRIGAVDLARLLQTINDRLEYLADRDRLIGHAYFTRVSSLMDLRGVFRRQVIPLLQEYFFDDWRRIEMVLSGPDGISRFIRRDTLNAESLFGMQTDAGAGDRVRYAVTSEDGWTEDAFASIYDRSGPTAPM
jgi:5-methylcytosine-specific restriction protein B